MENKHLHPKKNHPSSFSSWSLEWIRPASANGRSLQFSAAAPGGCTPLKHSLSWNKQDAQGQQGVATTMAVFLVKCMYHFHPLAALIDANTPD